MSAREVMREALCLSFYSTDWANTSAFRRGLCDDMARDGLAALSAAGLAVVPVEPTKAMVDAAFNADAWSQHAETYATIYRAMLAAAKEDRDDA